MEDNSILFIIIFATIFIIFLGLCFCTEYETFDDIYLSKEFDPCVLSNESRLNYYMGALINNFDIDKNKIKLGDEKYIMGNSYIKPEPRISLKYYGNEMKEYLNMINTNKLIYFLFGDVQYASDIPAIAKSRPVGVNYNILLKLNKPRHWKTFKTVDSYDIPYEEKDNKLIWRGSPLTGKGKRHLLVEKFFDIDNINIDIAYNFTSLKESTSEYRNYCRSSLTVRDMLKSKFLLSVKGNDVATNLKWILYSNSLCFMPEEQIHVSWLMEDKLVPWYHYIPLKSDFSDLEEKYQWCIQNEDKCKQIVQNASDYIKVFFDEENENLLNKQVLEEYLNLVNIY